jgi:hypothetical protein
MDEQKIEFFQAIDGTPGSVLTHAAHHLAKAAQ